MSPFPPTEIVEGWFANCLTVFANGCAAPQSIGAFFSRVAQMAERRICVVLGDGADAEVAGSSPASAICLDWETMVQEDANMLVLSRRLGERVLLKTDDLEIWLQVVDIDRGKIRLGISAPREVTVMREELLPPRTQAK